MCRLRAGSAGDELAAGQGLADLVEGAAGVELGLDPHGLLDCMLGPAGEGAAAAPEDALVGRHDAQLGPAHDGGIGDADGLTDLGRADDVQLGAVAHGRESMGREWSFQARNWKRVEG